MNLKEILNNSKSIDFFAKEYFLYLSKVFEKIKYTDFKKLEKEFLKLRKKQNTIFAIGNGGGASTGSAMSNDIGFDLLKKTKKKGFNVISLSDNSSIVTAISNDVGYDNLFLKQLENQYKKNDALLIFSASGNSKNLVLAAKWVKKKRGKVFSVIGFDGGKIKKLSDICLHFKSEKGEYGPVEDAQLITNHIFAHWFQKNLPK